MGYWSEVDVMMQEKERQVGRRWAWFGNLVKSFWADGIAYAEGLYCFEVMAIPAGEVISREATA